jgi:hypothetical protein
VSGEYVRIGKIKLFVISGDRQKVVLLLSKRAKQEEQQEKIYSKWKHVAAVYA